MDLVRVLQAQCPRDTSKFALATIIYVMCVVCTIRFLGKSARSFCQIADGICDSES